MITKFEAVGIALSIVLMSIALFFLNLDSKEVARVLPEADTQAASVIVVDDGEAQDQRLLAGALVESFNGTDRMQKVVVDDVKLGGGEEAIAGKTVRVHYVGRLENGQEFDNSQKRGTPFEFTLGAGEVIAGWEEGVLGMREGGERTLVVPPQFGYGTEGIGPIPPNATLLFSIELLEVI